MLGLHSVPLKELFKVKYDTTKTFAGYGFLKLECTLQTTGTNNKLDMGTFMLSCPSLTLKG